MAWALILHDNEDMLGYLAGAVAAVLTEDECKSARNVEEANALALSEGLGRCRLIVASLTARRGPSHVPTVDRRELTGLDLVRGLRAMGATTPALLIGSFLDAERVTQAGTVTGVQLLGAQELASALPGRILALTQAAGGPGAAGNAGSSTGLAATAPPSANDAAKPAMSGYRVDLDIVLRTGQHSRWSMKGANGISVEDSGKMDISDKELAQLVTKSGPVRLADSNFLRSLGLDVYQVLMADSIKSADLEIKLNDSVNSFGGLSIARIRFNVDKQTHPIHLETLAKPDESLSAPGYWMLRTPMFRKFGDRGERPPLFKDGRSRVEPVDCLVIQGCSTEFAVGDPLLREYKPLPAAESEARWLVDWLGEQGREIGAVTLLRHADHEPGRFAEAIRQALAARPYGLVHYCGHSEVDENDDESAAYLVLGEDDRDLVLVEDFAGWATSVQFMFLSSCHSANSLFIMKLVQAKVPAVAGYAWPMEDAVARRFSEAFYTCLFSEGRDKRYLEYSFMQAKRALHKQYRSKGHWVAPLLFMQVLDQVTA